MITSSEPSSDFMVAYPVGEFCNVNDFVLTKRIKKRKTTTVVLLVFIIFSQRNYYNKLLIMYKLLITINNGRRKRISFKIK